MANIEKDDRIFQEPATLSIGSLARSEITEIIHGTVSVDLPVINTVSAASASASVPGLTAAHRIFIMPQDWAAADGRVHIAAAKASADTLTVTAGNAHTANSPDITSQTFSFFAIR